MIKVEPCRGCGRLLYQASLGGLSYRAETEPLNAQEATRHLLGGGELYQVTQTSVSTATPAVLGALSSRGTVEGPTVVRRHVCTVRGTENLSEAVSALNSAPVTQSPRPTPQRPPAGRTAPSSGPSAAPSSVRRAERRNSEPGPRCEDCGLIMEEGDYVSAQLGSIYVWAIHLVNCSVA